MKKTKYIRNLLFLLFVFYYAQGSLYAQGSIIAKASLALVLVISGIYFIKTLLDRKKKNFFYKVWTALLLLNIVGFVFTANFGESPHVSMLKGILVTSFSFYPFYYFVTPRACNSCCTALAAASGSKLGITAASGAITSTS